MSSFDRVCHQRLMAKLAQRVGDRRLLVLVLVLVLVLIGRMLKAKVVLPDGVVIDSEMGSTPPSTSVDSSPVRSLRSLRGLK